MTSCKHIFQLNHVANTRSQLASFIGHDFNRTCPFCRTQSLYTVNNVFAGPSANHVPKTAGGSVAGAAIGAVTAGPPGAFIGFFIGLFAGNKISNNSEHKEINTFNNSTSY